MYRCTTDILLDQHLLQAYLLANSSGESADYIRFRSHSEIYTPFFARACLLVEKKHVFFLRKKLSLQKSEVSWTNIEWLGSYWPILITSTSSVSSPTSSNSDPHQPCCFQQRWKVVPSMEAYGHHGCWLVFWETCFFLAEHHKYQCIFQDLTSHENGKLRGTTFDGLVFFVIHLLDLQRQGSMEFCSWFFRIQLQESLFEDG